jgi:hypothetical protein
MLMFSYVTGGKKRQPWFASRHRLLQEITCHRKYVANFSHRNNQPSPQWARACYSALFGVLDELDALLGLGDQIRDHGVQRGLLGGRDGAVVQHFLHAVGAQAHLSARSNMQVVNLVRITPKLKNAQRALSPPELRAL